MGKYNFYNEYNLFNAKGKRGEIGAELTNYIDIYIIKYVEIILDVFYHCNINYIYNILLLF